jgi:hypothetical protein
MPSEIPLYEATWEMFGEIAHFTSQKLRTTAFGIPAPQRARINEAELELGDV